MDVVGRYIAILLAVILIVLFPLQYIAQAQSETMDSAICAFASEFTDTARHQGYISLEMYEGLIQKLDYTGELYDVTMEAAHPVSGKEIPEVTVGDKMPELNLKQTSFLGDKINSFATHTHSDDCYVGHRHVDSCYEPITANNSYYLGPTVNTIAESLPDGAYYFGSRSSKRTSIKCTACNNEIAYAYYNETSDKSIYFWGISAIKFNQRFLNGSGAIRIKQYSIPMYLSSLTNPGGWTYVNTSYTIEETVYIREYRTENPEFNYAYNNLIGIRGPLGTVNIENLIGLGYKPEYSCPYCINQGTIPGVLTPDAALLCNEDEDTMPICNQVVTSITPTNQVQTVNMGEAIITTATATFLDGHTGTVDCTSNFDTNTNGVQTVTLTYTGLVNTAKTTGTKTCTVQVTVKDPCKVTEINVTPTTQSINRYDSLYLTVTATYDNNTSLEVTDYSVADFNSAIIGTQIVTITYTKGDITKTATASVTVKNLTTSCPICNTVYELDELDRDHGCPVCSSEILGIIVTPENLTVSTGESLPITVEAVFVNGAKAIVTDWSSNYDTTITGIQEVMITYEEWQRKITVNVKDNKKTCQVCGSDYSINEDGSDPGCPLCKTEVVSITASPEQVTTLMHQALPLTVIATFRDGHTEEVTDWSTDLVTDTPGSFEVTVYYKSAMDYVFVTVLEDGKIQCPYCDLEYSFSEHPKGCPLCLTTIVGIEASLRNGGAKVLQHSQLRVQVIVIYQDTHRELTYEGWTVEGYQPDVLGIQTVSVYYKGHTTVLTVEVVKDLPNVICPKGHEYYLHEDGTDPGCPYCLQETQKESAVFFFDITYTSDIIAALYCDGIYYLKVGDYLTITVTQRNTSLRSNIKKMLIGTNRGISKKSFTFGGEII